MPTTKELIDESREVEEGILTDEESTIRRWRSCFQESMDLSWDAHFWAWKLKTAQITYDPTTDNFLPADFGSFEAKGAGVFGTVPVRPLSPEFLGVVKAYLYGVPNFTGIGSAFSVDYDLGQPRLLIIPKPSVVEVLNVLYLMRKPRLAYEGVDGWTDELFYLPVQWQRSVLQRGGEWRWHVKSGSGIATDYEAMWKTAQKQEFAREASGGMGLNRLTAYNPRRRR